VAPPRFLAAPSLPASKYRHCDSRGPIVLDCLDR
jgi:hypothetical protein